MGYMGSVSMQQLMLCNSVGIPMEEVAAKDPMAKRSTKENCNHSVPWYHGHAYGCYSYNDKH